ncbi:PAS domain-containing protein [Alsobacter sp. SYSU M60028]|uniref:histidine kinase n=1 Tax=Alsobacter ponti TaxID=2962936 RepID=A0ABT1L8U7_9HYPH|nr:PAS domain S-box protein [Alsobacter ponti]MCP8937453.1 PAS domain-containing protein [Alsobacter ponti]
MTPAERPQSLLFLAGGGAMGALMREHDWSESPLGPPETWPQSLRSVVGLLLGSKFPMFVAWGPDLGFLYNDPYAEILGAKHPLALGRRFYDIWSEIWPDISPLIDAAMAGEASYRENLPLLMNRKGFDEQTWFTFSYSPVRDESGSVAGMFCACTETTAQILADRRRSFLLDVEERLREASHARAAMDVAVEALGRHLGAVRVGYSEVNADGQTIICETCYADGVAPILGTFRLDDFGAESIARQRAGATEAVSDILADSAQRHDTWVAIDTRAFVSVPLVREGRLQASLYVNHRNPHAWTSHEVALIEEVAARTWAAVERARAEARLRESEARFRLMADAVPQIVWITDADGRSEFFNAQWYAYTGASPDPITNSEVIARYVHPEDGPVTAQAFEEARRTGRTFVVEHRIRSAAGAYRWFLVRGEPYRDPETGEVLRWFGASVDIHDRKVAEQALLALNADLEREVVERTRERGLIWRHRLDLLSVIDVATGRFDAVNPAWTVALGWTAEHLQSRPFAEFLHPEDLERSLAEFERVRAGGPVLHFENRYRTRDGGWRWLSWVAAPDSGKLYAVTRDVTREKERQAELEAAEAARRDADALYRTYFENTPEALFVIRVEPHDRFLVEELNPSHVASVGLKIEEVRGKRVEDILPHDLAREVLAMYRRVVRTGEVHQYREVFDLNGDAQHWDTALMPMRDASGRVVRLIGSSRNVTRQILAEEALRQSQKMEAMGQLTGGVAHDFNNLLTPIVGALDLLHRKGLGGAREQRLIAGAAQSAERAKILVQRLLAFARRQPLQTVPVDVAKLVTEMGELVASTTGPQIRVVVEASEDLPPALADPNQIEMALLNLSVNARDAMPDGGTLRISATSERVGLGHRAKLHPGEYVCLSVADTGSGMDDATLARAVEPFFSTKGVGKGTGLGLSMVHGLASQLGGALTIRSRPGFGTNVELWLPQSAAAPGTDERRPEPAQTAARMGTALLVDDEELVRLSTAEMLQELGYTVLEASSAEEALRLVERGDGFDLLVTDHLMPGMNGAELRRAIRSARPSVPVLLVSGYAEFEGVDPDHPRLTKPFRKDELAAALAQLSPGQ